MNFALILLGVVACAFGNTDEQVCIRRFTDSDTVFPDDELMNAFYIADPDPRTGYVKFTSRRFLYSWRSKISLSLVTLPYDPWLKRQHNGKDHFQNLWVYVTRLIASGIDELYLHYSSVKRYTSTKPRVPIDFHKLKTIFSDVCGAYETYNSSWPFFCFDSNFFCAFNQSLETLDNIFANKTTWEILAMSKITVDNDDRNKAIIGMFHNDIIKYFSTDVQYRPLYRSSLITKCVEMLVSPDDRTNNWINNSMLRLLPKIELACSNNTNNTIGKAYYCPAKYYIIKTIECSNTKNGRNCIYLSIFQEYFENGRFVTPSEKRILGNMKSITEKFIHNMVSAIVRKHYHTMNNLVDSIHQFLDVDPSSCTYRQWKTFDCGTDERCKIRIIYRFDCIVLFLVKSAKNFLLIKESQTKSEAEMMKVKRLLNIVLFYPPYVYDSTLPRHEIDESIVTLHKEVDDLRNKFEIAGFEELNKFFPPENFLPARVERDACLRETISNLYKPFCLVSPLVDSIQQFIRSVRNSQNAKMRVLNPSVDYTSLLSQLQLSRVSSFLNKQAQTYFNILARKIDEIPNYLQENFHSIGNYFSSLAEYDSKKSTADILYINGALKKFKTQLDSKATEMAGKIKLLFGLAIGSTLTESLSRMAMFAVEVARNFNPLLHLFGGSDPNSLADRINDMTKSVVAVSKVIQIGVRVIPEIAARAKKLQSGFRENAEFINVVKILILNLNSENLNLEREANYFLKKYNDYSPKVLRSDITGLGAYWEAAVDELCDAAFEGGTAASAVIQIGIASKGDCISSKPLIAEITTINEGIFDFQFEMMETLARACRAKYAAQLANKMKIAFVTNVKVDMNFFRINAIISYLVSTLHVWEVVTEYCDSLTYIESGVTPYVCKQAKELPDENNVARVLSYKPISSCSAGSRTKQILKIGTTRSASNKNKDVINIKKLFNGEEVTFQIPNSSWLVRNRVIPSSEAESVIYVEQFQLFLPIDPIQSTQVQLKVTPHHLNVLRKDDVGYFVNLHGFESRYTVNEPFCSTPKEFLLYDYCQSLSKICVLKNGKQERVLQPSIYNKWTIQLTDPVGLKAPNAVTDLNLIARFTYCSQNTKQMSLLNSVKFDTTPSHCCEGNQYLSDGVCKDCPSGSSRHLSGHYCNKQPANFQYNHDLIFIVFFNLLAMKIFF